ncbi:SNF2 family N-terminal domain-containing protein [Cantharellus anzutake]|uniref:SNF2 family N-terminal domain-containing protein n=1 Tax=Cantharellus anzutake TaxID=1750568 RepID=UPI001905C2FA|nr:SNF2 family N-terminal domain-containing protein [Cantharellus anzutake]KAF8332093.1 SNF2 family N-terminal domain-containing protein [Cantharellus anzutake]
MALVSPKTLEKRKSAGGYEGNPRHAKRPHIAAPQVTPSASDSRDAQYWMVQWRKPQMKKNKTWEGDGVFIIREGACELQNLDGQKIAGARSSGIGAVSPGDVLNLAGKEIEIDYPIPREDFISGKCFDVGGAAPVGSAALTTPKPSMGAASSAFTPFKSMIPKVSLKSNPPPIPNLSRAADMPLQSQATRTNHMKGAHDLIPGDPTQDEETLYWTVQWRKPQTRKNKSWEGDAFVSQKGCIVTFIGDDGAILGNIYNAGKLRNGTALYIAGMEIEVDARIPCLPFQPHRPLPAVSMCEEETEETVQLVKATSTKPRFISPISKVNTPKTTSGGVDDMDFVKRLQRMAHIPFYGPSKKYSQLHDPNAPDALVMPRPDKDHEKKYNKKGAEVVPVVVDPIIAKKLRPHQREGVIFMYESVMGMRKHDGLGCILADEMGLGKTIQTIALLWTLLKQNLYAGQGPVAGKALIVCPVSLLSNWKKEIHKWLGRDRIEVMLGDKDISVIKGFQRSKHQVLIIGYERLRSVIEELAYCHPPVGLIICDEGHRLKSAGSKTTKMFDVLRVPRRIILTGTPVQNNLGEFHSMANFVNPGLLDTYKTFSKIYEIPILRSRAPDCSEKEYELGSARAEHLAQISQSFVLRRTAGILSNYLPPKNEYVVFVRPTKLQLAMFKKILVPERLDDLIMTSTANSLALIGRLKQLCNSPLLLRHRTEEKEELQTTANNAIKNALALISESAKQDDMTLSGKMMTLQKLLRILRRDTDEKVVIVSHYTATLNVIEKFCVRKKYTFSRLDGSTKVELRQMYVDKFNKSPQAEKFVFLLSTKAGGVGLNLIGASRLILVDSDWNPSHDLQAMARIHRDGQKRPVFIYRLLTCGTIDEKIFQRAVTKMGLSESLMGDTSGADGGKGSKGDSFSQTELKDLFTIHPAARCHTHELLACSCVSGTSDGALEETGESGGLVDEVEDKIEDSDDDDVLTGFVPASQYKPPKNKMSTDKSQALVALTEWTHVNALNPAAREYIHDNVLLKVIYSPDTPQTGDGSLGGETPGTSCSLLDSLDSANLEDDSGSVAFVFEKISKSEAIPDTSP